MRNHSNGNEFDLHENEPVGRTRRHFHMNGFAFRLVLTRRHKGTRKWPITNSVSELSFAYWGNIGVLIGNIKSTSRYVWQVSWTIPARERLGYSQLARSKS